MFTLVNKVAVFHCKEKKYYGIGLAFYEPKLYSIDLQSRCRKTFTFANNKASIVK